MALVSYSESEGSENETGVKKAARPEPSRPKPDPSTAKADIQSFVDRSNPRKIRVALPDTRETSSREDVEDGPAPKRARLGGSGGTLSGFNSMLPAPKKPQQSSSGKGLEGSKGQPRKMFSLKTGATPGFDRNADAEFVADFGPSNREAGGDHDDSLIQDATHGSEVPKSSNPATEPPIKGNPMMFKPLSVARKPQKKKSGSTSASTVAPDQTSNTSTPSTTTAPKPPPLKPSLFSLGSTQDPTSILKPSAAEYKSLLQSSSIPSFLDEDPFPEETYDTSPPTPPSTKSTTASTSLDNIASDLNLSAAERRQLFGRSGKGGTAVNVINFNTDKEYDANEALRAAGDQVQHNPVRSIAPGKHSLKQLVNAASNQKDALEESFASGKRNKKEAGSKYGW